jgi:hypothetical protein
MSSFDAKKHKSANPRIINGISAQLYEFPFDVNIVYDFGLQKPSIFVVELLSISDLF